MRTPRPLPASLGPRFSVQQAANAGANRGRLRRNDLHAPFHGVRARHSPSSLDDLDPFERQAAERRLRARQYAPRLRSGQFLSHESAIALLGGPLPLVWADAPGRRREPADGRTLDVHVSTLGDGPLVRAKGVRGHRAGAASAWFVTAEGFALARPATAWAQLGAWSLIDLVALGDFLCRVWREGPGRPNAGARPLTTVAQLGSTLASARWAGIPRLRRALELIREDS